MTTRGVFVVFALLASLTALAMPTQKELDKAEPVVETILADSRSSLKAGELSHMTFADLCVSFSEQTESDAVKYLLLERAFSHYVKAGEYESTERTLERLMSEIRNVPPFALVRLLDKSVPSAVRKDVPWFMRVKKAAKAMAKDQDRLPDVVKAVKRQPTNPNAMRQLGLCYARVGNWTKALAAFARAGGELAAMARAEVARTKPLNEIADFWRDLDRDEISYQIHAATLYKGLLESPDVSDLMQAYAEKCIEKIEADEEVGAYRLVMGGAGADSSACAPTVSACAPTAFSSVPTAFSSAPTSSSSALSYCVIDLSGGPDARHYPVSYLQSPPASGFNTAEYKTTKLVLKRVEAGSLKLRGDAAVTLTKPFYMGLFEVTQKQWMLVMGSNPSCFQGEMNPVERVSYNDIRGSSKGAAWPASNAVDSESFLGKLRDRTQLDFDLPTEAQWERACLAGTTTNRCHDDSVTDDYMWHANNASSKTHEVGTKKANKWGFYDMKGNVWEWCLDWFAESLSGGTDPKGLSSGSCRTGRGGCWENDANFCDIYCWYCGWPLNRLSTLGFRLCRTIEKK